MHREALRTATSLLCKEMMRPVQSTGLGMHESEEVEARLQPLARLERVWGKSGASANGSVSQLGATGSGIIGGTAVSTSGEERERRLFTEALQDGYVLCQWVFFPLGYGDKILIVLFSSLSINKFSLD
jgi:hypothetical protein